MILQEDGMEYTLLKNSDLTVSRIGMGGCPMGQYGWGKVAESDLIGAVHTSLDQGITLFDTADTYGLGQSEINLAKALGPNRKEAIIASKFGVRVENGHTFYDNSPTWIHQALENSLRRLNTDYIDLYQVHYRDGVTPISVVVDTLEDLKKQGYIRCYGLSNISEEDLSELLPYEGCFVSFQDEYSLACRKHEKTMTTLAEKLNMTPVTWGSLGQGILTGKYDRDTLFGSDDRRSRDVYVNFHGEKLLKNLEIVDAMKSIAQNHDRPVSAVAIRFILDYLPDSVVLCGAKRPAQVLGNAAGSGWTLDPEELRTLDEISRD